MKRLAAVAIVALLILSLASCDFLDQLLSVNLFDAPLKLSAADIADKSLDELSQLSGSPDFYDAVWGDAALTAAVLDQADAGVLSGDPATVQQAAILGADLYIYGSGADALINNVIAQYESFSGDPPDDPAEIEAFLNTLVPASLLADEAAFVAMINALVEADAYYQNLSDPVGVDPELVNAGEIAQNALVAAFVAEIVPHGNWVIANPSGTLGEYLFDLLTIPATDAPTTYAPPNTSTGYLGNILSAAGIVF
jgi:hypothetical protein